jgi:ubiquinone/menaquinone biosynthesis C-methylase UbiE
MLDPDHKEIYARHAERYEQLVSREDYQGNLLPALERVRPLAGMDVVELGAGTGRLTCMLAPVARTLCALDASRPMLEVAVTRLEKSGVRNWHVAVADHRHLPLAGRVADVVLAGWSLCYLVAWEDGSWPDQVGRALAEMKRVLRPGGTIVLLETLGTGHETPRPPDALVPYYAFLEGQGFSSTWVRTDYAFASLAEAASLTRFFFGQALAEQVVDRKWVILPECTGIWWLALV